MGSVETLALCYGANNYFVNSQSVPKKALVQNILSHLFGRFHIVFDRTLIER